MRLLSPLHAGLLSALLVTVNRRAGFEPSAGTIHRSDTAAAGSYEGSETEKTAHLPSGLGTGAPTVLARYTSSCVIGDLAYTNAGRMSTAARQHDRITSIISNFTASRSASSRSSLRLHSEDLRDRVHYSSHL